MSNQDRCPACESVRGEVVYRCNDIPVQSCVMLESAEEARDYPLADLRLFACRDCGFLSTLAFDYETQGAIEAYETSQAVSGHFSAYQTGICLDLLARHDLSQKLVVEIGCGSGDFLRELCKVAECRGIGYDPALADSLVTRSDAEPCQLVKAAFTNADLGEVSFDLLACRHTLEHIAMPGELVSLCAEASRRSDNAPIFFEVPDILRILRDNAFWDVYYEHCSYFSMGSLARLFRRCGLEVLDLERVYDDQYLLITARPATGTTKSDPTPGEDDLEEILSALESFKRDVGQTLGSWRERFDRAEEGKQRIALWGSGSKAAGFLSTLGIREQIPYIVDINPHKQGLFQAGTGQEIVAPARLQEYRPDLLIIMNGIYREEIQNDLHSMGLSPEIVAL